MSKLKLITVVGTRPEIIRLSRVLERCNQFFDHILVHTGQNYDYELNEIFFKDLGLKKPKYFLNAVGDTTMATVGNIISKFDKVLDEVQPDAILVLGDTNSCLSVLPAKRKKIPIFHMEAGNRCFDDRVPEEINRRIVDHTADINLTYSSIAREYLLKEGLPADRIIKTGSPMYEVLSFYRHQIESSSILDELHLQPYEYFLVSAHREENIDSTINFNKLVLTLNTIGEKYKIPVIVSTHPRTQKKIDFLDIKFSSFVRLLKPLGFFDYNKLQMMARVALSDSGTISEESSILNFPALNIREAHERPESFEEASVMMVGVDQVKVLQGIEILKTQGRDQNRNFNIVADYSSPNVSDKVARIILSYTDYVNRVVWKKYL